MKTKKQELRELVNQKLPERLKLEFGCEVTIDDEDLLLYNSETKRTITYGVNGLGEIKVDSEQKYIKKKSIGKILGKQVSLQEILMLIEIETTRVLGSNEKYFESMIVPKGFLLLWHEDGTDILIDLSKEIEEQDDEVIDKIIKLIK